MLKNSYGSNDSYATSTAEKFLQHNVITYEVHFYDQDKRQKIDWFDVETEGEAWSTAVKEHGKGIQKIRVIISNRTRDEIMSLD
ncbi:hypothetical protein [Bacillus wiedmannii]|uniref:hypothetical protein n=1 Tax=Bacillus wiedmannii TaxID=1890302 RepID=UPI000BFE6B24|nr:hypothetical protein [Bacillus wiedmannii]PHF05486.1 hypothetical protein COF74_24835 [Bacillus wiedmannii]